MIHMRNKQLIAQRLSLFFRENCKLGHRENLTSITSKRSLSFGEVAKMIENDMFTSEGH